MIIIPARLNSTRFPSKILCDIGGEPMFIRSAKNAMKCDDVVVALDSNHTMEIAKKHGVKAVLTNPDIPNGSLRVLEATRILGIKNDTQVINLQADEPFLESEVIESLKQCLEDSYSLESSSYKGKHISQNIFMATCAKKISLKEAEDSNLVKVVLDSNFNAIYFSRSVIPFCRDSKDSKNIEYLGHLGLYGYTKENLERLSRLPETQLENIEKLEQLRAIYHGKKIRVAIVKSQSIGIDTPEDLKKALNFMERHKNISPY